jgi:putative ABC transport system permease protein
MVLYAGDRYREYFIRLDARVFAFSAGAMLLVAAIGALIPLRDVWKVGVMPALQAVSSPSANRWLAALVVVQLALVTAVADSAGMLWRSLENVAAVRPAMDPDRKLLIVAGYWNTGGRLATRSDRLAGELSTLPGVVRVAYCRRVMLWGSEGGLRTAFERPGQPKLTFQFNQVSPSYFATTGARVLRGRAFSEGDGPDSTPVAMVSESLVRKFFPTQEPLGAWVRLGGKDRQIVGIVEDGPANDLKENIEPFVYFPYGQFPSDGVTYFLETTRDAEGITAPAQERIRKTDSAYVAHDFLTLKQHMRRQRNEDELAADISGGMALLCMVLATAGLFGVTLYAVGRRMREFGIRVALGATPSLLARQVIREALRLTLAGAALGCGLALAGQQLLRGLLFGINPWSPWMLAGAVVLVTLVALAAAALPARRAANADPIAALRIE